MARFVEEDALQTEAPHEEENSVTNLAKHSCLSLCQELEKLTRPALGSHCALSERNEEREGNLVKAIHSKISDCETAKTNKSAIARVLVLSISSKDIMTRARVSDCLLHLAHNSTDILRDAFVCLAQACEDDLTNPFLRWLRSVHEAVDQLQIISIGSATPYIDDSLTTYLQASLAMFNQLVCLDESRSDESTGEHPGIRDLLKGGCVQALFWKIDHTIPDTLTIKRVIQMKIHEYDAQHCEELVSESTSVEMPTCPTKTIPGEDGVHASNVVPLEPSSQTETCNTEAVSSESDQPMSANATSTESHTSPETSPACQETSSDDELISAIRELALRADEVQKKQIEDGTDRWSNESSQ